MATLERCVINLVFLFLLVNSFKYTAYVDADCEIVVHTVNVLDSEECRSKFVQCQEYIFTAPEIIYYTECTTRDGIICGSCNERVLAQDTCLGCTAETSAAVYQIIGIVVGIILLSCFFCCIYVIVLCVFFGFCSAIGVSGSSVAGQAYMGRKRSRIFVFSSNSSSSQQEGNPNEAQSSLHVASIFNPPPSDSSEEELQRQNPEEQQHPRIEDPALQAQPGHPYDSQEQPEDLSDFQDDGQENGIFYRPSLPHPPSSSDGRIIGSNNDEDSNNEVAYIQPQQFLDKTNIKFMQPIMNFKDSDLLRNNSLPEMERPGEEEVEEVEVVEDSSDEEDDDDDDQQQQPSQPQEEDQGDGEDCSSSESSSSTEEIDD